MKIKFRQKNLKKILKFLILFNALSIPLYVMIFLNIQLYPLQDLTAKAVFNILNFFGIESNLDDLFISVPTGNGYFAGIIDWDCTGWKSILVFFALVFATETKIEKKISSFAQNVIKRFRLPVQSGSKRDLCFQWTGGDFRYTFLSFNNNICETKFRPIFSPFSSVFGFYIIYNW